MGGIGKLRIAAALLLAAALPAHAQAARPIDGLADGVYYVHGRRVAVESDAGGGITLRYSFDGDVIVFTVNPDRTVKVVQKSIFFSLAAGAGFAGPMGLLTSNFFLGRGPDNNFYWMSFLNSNGRLRNLRFSRLVPESEPNAVQMSRDSEIKDVPAIEALIGCAVTALGRCVAGPKTDLAANTLQRPVVGAARPSVVGPVAVPVLPVASGTRMALIIANSAYAGGLGQLANPVNDARVVSAALRQAQFDVTVVTEADQRAMKRAIVAFGARLASAGRDATALFYYAGHGVQARGANYLIPVGAAIDTEADVDIEAVEAGAVLRQMEQPNVVTNIVILDACRNLPVRRATRDGTRGLARMDAPTGAFIAYSTAPGQVAYDGVGGNSAFARALAAEMAKPQSIEATFRNVRRAVVTATAGKQTPWDNSSLVNGFAFKAN